MNEKNDEYVVIRRRSADDAAPQSSGQGPSQRTPRPQSAPRSPQEQRRPQAQARPQQRPAQRPSQNTGRAPAHASQTPRRAAPANSEVIRRRSADGQTSSTAGRTPGAASGRPRPQTKKAARPMSAEERRKAAESKKRRGIALCMVVLIIAVVILVAAIHRENPDKLAKSELKVEISEFMPNNTSYYIADGKAVPWLELHNYGKTDVDLSGAKLVSGRKKASLSSYSLKAGEYLLLCMANDGENATGVGIPSDAKEAVYVKDSNGCLVDLVRVGEPEPNVSLVRSHSGGDVKESASKSPTPGYANTEKGFKKFLASRYVENDTGIVINEVMASNDNAYFDKFGGAVDYIELANVSKKKANVGGFGVSDSEKNVFKFVIPKKTVIKPGECLLINCSSDYANADPDDISGDEGVLYAPFSIKGGKEGVFLSNEKAYIVDGINGVSAEKDKSLSLVSGSARSMTYNITPGLPNTIEGVREYRSRSDADDVSSKKVFISEVSSRNTKYAPVNESYYDWIELYNPTGKDVSLKGYGLSDKGNADPKFKFGDVTIKSKDYLVVYATGKTLSNVITTGFELNGSSAVYLTDKDGKLIDNVLASELLCNVSKGREGTKGQWKYFETPTPGSANGKGKTLISDAPTASKPSAKYENVDSLSVELYGRGTIYYTTDGSVPSKSSKKYDGALNLKKTTVIRAICVEEDAVPSSASAFTYLINEGHELDVVSVISDPDGFFSYSSGIYEMGGHASSVFPYQGANFWQKWKRPTTLQLISDNEPGFSADCEASIFGGYSRAYDKKSIKFKFKDIYGAGKLNYPVFANRDFDEYDSLVLRAGGQDVSKAMMKDDLTTYLADPVIDVMATRPVVMYINGRYWGIYYIREKINADYVATRYNVSKESVDIIQASSYANTGTSDDWKELLAYVKSHNLSNEDAYKYVTDRVDVQNYADYIIAELYCGNTDAGNIRCYRTREGDSKWRWIFYDTDLGFQLGLKRSAFELLNPNGNGAYDMFPTTLTTGLFKNKSFQKLFKERLEYQMHNIWNTDRVLSTIDMFYNALAKEVPRNHQRWNLDRDWAGYVEGLRTFARGRQAVLKDEFANDSGLRSIIALSEAELNKCFE